MLTNVQKMKIGNFKTQVVKGLQNHHKNYDSL
jgi:hypothetical protein